MSSIVTWMASEVSKIERDVDRIRMRQVERESVPLTEIRRIASEANEKTIEAKARARSLSQVQSAVRTGRRRLSAAASQFGPIWDAYLARAERAISTSVDAALPSSVALPVHVLVLAADSVTSLSDTQQRLLAQESQEISFAADHLDAIEQLRARLADLEVAIQAATRELRRSERSRTAAEAAAAHVADVLDEYGDLFPRVVRLVEERAGTPEALAFRKALEPVQQRAENGEPES